MTVVEQLEAQGKELATAQAGIADLTAKLAAKDAELAAAGVALKAAQADVAKAQADVKTAQDAAKAEADAHGKTKVELDKAQKALANPAFAAAAAVGDVKPVAEGAPEAGKAAMTKAEMESEYEKITDAKERAKYRKEHAKELGLPVE